MGDEHGGQALVDGRAAEVATVPEDHDFRETAPFDAPDFRAEMARLRGAVTVIVGIQPDVAYAMVELGMSVGWVRTALDLEEGLEWLGT